MTDETRSEWQTKELADAFLQGVRGAIPAADLQLAILAKIAQRWNPQARRLLDLGCGNGILGACLLRCFSSAHCLFMDFSEPMLAAARKNIGALPNATITRADFGSPDWRNAAAPHAPFDIVVSGFAIHHQPDERKQALYAEIHALLAPGGVFLNLEHVASATPAGEELFDDYFVDHLHAFHRTTDPSASRESVAEKYYKRADKKENILAPVETQCQWLRQMGFADVDCFFKTFELALFGGRKPGTPH